jgi:hypothetical protein
MQRVNEQEEDESKSTNTKPGSASEYTKAILITHHVFKLL